MTSSEIVPPARDRATRGSVLVVAFEREDNVRYPHLKAVLDMLRCEVSCEYLCFRARFFYLRLLGIIIIDLLRLALRMRHFNVVVAVDNFTFSCASLFHQNVILWSHDFVTADQPPPRTWIQCVVTQWIRKSLSRSRRIIIQDESRNSLFKQTFGIKQVLDTYLLPVSLPACDTHTRSLVQGVTPVLMQIGGINSIQSGSDQLIGAYQHQADHYRLVLHGHFAPSILELLRSVEFVPLCSMVDIPAAGIFRLVQYADIGFIYYVPENQNFFHIAYASGQLCEFIRCGKPIISCGKTDLRTFVEEQGIGVSIQSLDELPQAINRIISRYKDYSRRSYELFHASYDLNLHCGKLASWIFKDTV